MADAQDQAQIGEQALRIENAQDFGKLLRELGYSNIAWCVENAQTGTGNQEPLCNLLNSHDGIVKDLFNYIENGFKDLLKENGDKGREIEFLNVRLDELRNTRTGDSAPRRITSDPPPFTGEETDIVKRQIDFLNFWAQLQRVLTNDVDVFDTPYKQLSQLAGLMKGKAQYQYRVAISSLVSNPTDESKWSWKSTPATPSGEPARSALENAYLDLARQYVTVDLKLAAKFKFDELYMKDSSFANFLSELIDLGDQCGKTEDQLTDAMRMKVSTPLDKAVANQTERPTTFDGWCALYQKLWDNLQESKHYAKLRQTHNPSSAVNQHKNSQQNQKKNNGNQAKQQQQLLPPIGDPMQLDAISQTTFAFNRLDLHPNQCAYCRNFGHRKETCPERPENGGPGRGGHHNGDGRGRGTFGRGHSAADRGNASLRGSSGGTARGGFPPATRGGYANNYQPQASSFSYGFPQQQFHNQWGTGNPYARLRQIDTAIPVSGYAYSLPDSQTIAQTFTNQQSLDTPAASTPYPEFSSANPYAQLPQQGNAQP